MNWHRHLLEWQGSALIVAGRRDILGGGGGDRESLDHSPASSSANWSGDTTVFPHPICHRARVSQKFWDDLCPFLVGAPPRSSLPIWGRWLGGPQPPHQHSLENTCSSYPGLSKLIREFWILSPPLGNSQSILRKQRLLKVLQIQKTIWLVYLHVSHWIWSQEFWFEGAYFIFVNTPGEKYIRQ